MYVSFLTFSQSFQSLIIFVLTEASKNIYKLQPGQLGFGPLEIPPYAQKHQ